MYYELLAKERGSKLIRIRNLIELGRSIEASPGALLDSIMKILDEPLGENGFETENYLNKGYTKLHQD